VVKRVEKIAVFGEKKICHLNQAFLANGRDPVENPTVWTQAPPKLDNG
jgi:hypothetical protein